MLHALFQGREFSPDCVFVDRMGFQECGNGNLTDLSFCWKMARRDFTVVQDEDVAGRF